MLQGSLLYIRHGSESVSNAGVRIRTIKLTGTQKAVRFTIKNVNTFSCICLILFVFRFLFQTPHFLLKCLKREKILLSLKLLRIMIWVRFYDRSLLKELLSGKWFLQICVTSDFFFFIRMENRFLMWLLKPFSSPSSGTQSPPTIPNICGNAVWTNHRVPEMPLALTLRFVPPVVGSRCPVHQLCRT